MSSASSASCYNCKGYPLIYICIHLYEGQYMCVIVNKPVAFYFHNIAFLLCLRIWSHSPPFFHICLVSRHISFFSLFSSDCFFSVSVFFLSFQKNASSTYVLCICNHMNGNLSAVFYIYYCALPNNTDTHTQMGRKGVEGGVQRKQQYN